MAAPFTEPDERTSNTDPKFVPPSAVVAILRTWEAVLAERHPGTRWTLTYTPPDD
jgi:hypothetical protein